MFDDDDIYIDGEYTATEERIPYAHRYRVKLVSDKITEELYGYQRMIPNFRAARAHFLADGCGTSKAYKLARYVCDRYDGWR